MKDNNSKHKSEIYIDDYIKKIQSLEYPVYSLDLNPIENVWANIKYKLGGNVNKKIQSFKLRIEEY